MSLTIGVPKELAPGERRVATVPREIAALKKTGAAVLVEAGAGEASGYPDAEYVGKGAQTATRTEVFAAADLLLVVRAPGTWGLAEGVEGTPASMAPTSPTSPDADLALLRAGQAMIGFADPLSLPAASQRLAERGVSLFAVELMPRITRAQSMDALSSMATLAGYRAVLLGAEHLPRLFPMLMTAAGSVTPARVLVIGAGVAGLFAAATARRLGAVVSAYDVRPAAREQVESVGAKFVSLPLEASGSEGRGGYAREMDAEFYRRQRELMADTVRQHDVVITTAAVPGKRAPVLVTAEMVASMAPGSVVVDVAAERGGNCEVTRPGETVVTGGVTVLGPLNLAATVPYHASQLYARNLATFVAHLVRDGELRFDLADEITRETLVARGGEIVHERLRPPAAAPAGAPAAAAAAPAAAATGASAPAVPGGASAPSAGAPS